MGEQQNNCSLINQSLMMLETIASLSAYTVLVLPLLAINHLKHLMNSFVVKFGVNSKCTALLRLHEKRSMYALDSFFDFVR